MVIARVQAIATAAGCQLVATCDLAVAAESAGFALPGGKAGWFCHTPAVPVARNVGRKRLDGAGADRRPVDAVTAADWGLINHAVPDAELDAARGRAARQGDQGSRFGKGVGKQTLYAQLDRPEADAYAIAVDVMASLAVPGAREGMALPREAPPRVARLSWCRGRWVPVWAASSGAGVVAAPGAALDRRCGRAGGSSFPALVNGLLDEGGRLLAWLCGWARSISLVAVETVVGPADEVPGRDGEAVPVLWCCWSGSTPWPGAKWGLVERLARVAR